MASNFEIINLDCAVYGYSDGQDFVEKPCVLRCGHASCKNCIPTDKVIIFKICNIKNEIDLAKMKEQDSFKIKTLISIHFKELFKTLKSCYDCSLNSKMISSNYIYYLIIYFFFKITSRTCMVELSLKLNILKKK